MSFVTALLSPLFLAKWSLNLSLFDGLPLYNICSNKWANPLYLSKLSWLLPASTLSLAPLVLSLFYIKITSISFFRVRCLYFVYSLAGFIIYKSIDLFKKIFTCLLIAFFLKKSNKMLISKNKKTSLIYYIYK